MFTQSFFMQFEESKLVSSSLASKSAIFRYSKKSSRYGVFIDYAVYKVYDFSYLRFIELTFLLLIFGGVLSASF